MSSSLFQIRLDLAARSQWNLGYFYAGLVFWIYAGVIGWLLPLHLARYYWLFGTSIIVPAALVASRLLGADPFSKGNPLGEVVGQTHASVMAMTFPLVLIACFQYPQFMILIMAISFSLDFYLMSWAFGSRLFAIHAFARTAVVTGLWLLLPGQRAWLIPTAVALAYGITIAISPTLRRRWLAAQARTELANAT